MEQRDSFLIFMDMLTCLDYMTNEQAGKLFKAILKFHKAEELTFDDPFVEMSFRMCEKRFEDNAKKWEDTKRKRSEAGKKGMASRWSDNKQVTNDNKTITNDNNVIESNNKDITKITDNVNVNVNVNEINKEIEDKSSIKKEEGSKAIFDSSMLPTIPPPPSTEEVKKEPTKRFVPPTLEEVKAYIKEKGYTFSAEAFVGFYESNGWMVGKNKMKNWHGACATWQSKRNEEKPQSLATQVMRNKRYTQYKQQSNGTDTRPRSESDNELW